ncbi:MAG: excinuclease ABC subunit UvrA, partial [Anaerovibrio sp.]|nr:excinuclease ABC subunit UvrA [Anaerovibrio sp.]
MEKYIRIKGARVHNLENINVDIPRDKMVVVTGLSGSGKSSLAFDTVYAEGQRRYVESLSSYARMFLGQMDKPDVDYIEGLSPAISIDQKTTSRNPRSTVGTVTEIYDYMRLLFARAGRPHCPKCGKLVNQQSIDQMLAQLLELPERTKLLIIAQVVRGKKGEHKKLLEHIRKEGYIRVRIDGEIMDANDEINLEKNKKHTIEVVVDRLVIRDEIRQRLAESMEAALKLGEGVAYVQIVDGEMLMFSQNFACIDCGISLPEIAPRMFSFNNPFGACPACSGLGSHSEFDIDLVMPDTTLSLAQGLIVPLTNNPKSYTMCQMSSVCEAYGATIDTPWEDMKPELQEELLYGTGEKTYSFGYENMYGVYKIHTGPFEGIMPLLDRRYRESDSDAMREDLENYMTIHKCPVCNGARLKPESLSVTVGEKNIQQVTEMTVRDCATFFDNLELTQREQKIAAQILKEIHARLGFLVTVGLDYLTLSRAAGTLSGG